MAVAAPPGGADVARIHRRDAVEGAELEAARIRGARVVDVIRRFPGITVREGRFDTGTESGTGVCVESSHRLQRLEPPRGSDRGRFCEMVPVYVDGVRVGNAITFLNGLAVDEFESIELVPAAVAATRYGLDAGAAGGALVLTSRRRSRQEP
ncbi:MAG: TonB-dependent receptor plug domain-containing protein [Gemmatimonadetes bacterium]|nr:TonB-dependent receptor plug domain-containing protein [Gemmatimonadota bacterium]